LLVSVSLLFYRVWLTVTKNKIENGKIAIKMAKTGVYTVIYTPVLPF